MNERVLGSIRVERLASTARMLTILERQTRGRVIQEDLFFTPDRVIVANITGRLTMNVGRPNTILLFCIFYVFSLIGGGAAINATESAVEWEFLTPFFGWLTVMIFVSPLFMAIIIFFDEKVQPRRKEKKYSQLSPEDILKHDKKNFAITNSEILRVDIWKGPRKIRLFTADSNQYTWNLLKAGELDKEFESYVNLLLSLFEGKLFVGGRRKELKERLDIGLIPQKRARASFASKVVNLVLGLARFVYALVICLILLILFWVLGWAWSELLRFRIAVLGGMIVLLLFVFMKYFALNKEQETREKVECGLIVSIITIPFVFGICYYLLPLAQDFWSRVIEVSILGVVILLILLLFISRVALKEEIGKDQKITIGLLASIVIVPTGFIVYYLVFSLDLDRNAVLLSLLGTSAIFVVYYIIKGIHGLRKDKEKKIKL